MMPMASALIQESWTDLVPLSVFQGTSGRAGGGEEDKALLCS